MNKTELIKEVAKKSGYTQGDTANCIDALIKVITNTLVAGDSISLSGFGKFSVSERAEHAGRNPIDGSPITIPACKCPKFKFSDVVKTTINE